MADNNNLLGRKMGEVPADEEFPELKHENAGYGVNVTEATEGHPATISVDNSIVNSTTVLPAASSEQLGKTYLLLNLQMGYTRGHVYKCVVDSSSGSDVYSWEDQNIGRLPVGNTSKIALIRQGSTARIRWTDPEDPRDQTGVILVHWAKTILVRNPDHEPTSIEDGTVVLTETQRNQYSQTMYADNSLDVDHETYYYKLFPMSEDGYITNDSVNAVEATGGVFTWAALKLMIEDGTYKDMLPVGSVLTLPRHDDYGEMEAEVVGYEDNVDLVDTEKTKAIVLQMRYLLTSGKQFDAPEAYAVLTEDETFQAGKRYGAYYKFTTDTEAVAGTKYFERNADFSFTEKVINPGDPIEANTLYVAIVGADPTKFTDLTIGAAIPADTYYELNVDANRKNYGNNNWHTSAARKYLNSSAPKGEWWEASSIWDKQPAYAASLVGFLGGFHDEDFLSSIAKVKNRNALPTIDGAGYTDTEDFVWLPSKYQLGGDALNNGVQENKCPLTKYKNATNADRVKMYKTSTSGQWYFTRSAHTGNSYNVWIVNTGGSFGHNSAYGAFGFAPCLVIA